MADTESSNPSPKIIRQTGRLETLGVVHEALGLYTSVMVGAQYSHSAPGNSGKLDKDTLYPALHRVIHREPALRMALIGSRVPVQTAECPAFVECQVDDQILDRICVFRDDVRWDDDPEHVAEFTRFMEAEFEIAFGVEDVSIPLWRLVICADNTILFFYHHAIGDGKSGVAFHVMLLSALNSSPTIPIPKSQPLIPSIEDTLDVRPSLWKLLRAILTSYLPSSYLPPSWSPLHHAWTGNPVPSADPENTSISKDRLTPLFHPSHSRPRIELLTLSPSESKALLTLCRKHNATITSFLYTLIISIFSQIVITEINTSLDPTTTPYTKLATYLPVSLRPLSGAPEMSICDHPSSWKTFPLLQPEFRWEDARTHAAALKMFMKNGGEAQQEVGMLRLYRGDYASPMKTRLGVKRRGTFELSNVGRFSASSASVDVPADEEEGGEGRWKVGKTIFAQSGVIMDAAMNFSVIGHGSGGLTVSMIWGPYTLDEEVAMQVVRSMRGELKGFVDSSSDSSA